MTRTLVVMVKDPRPGRVKTRLAREIGPVAAAWWYRHQCAGLIRRLRDPRWHLVLAITPDRAARLSRVWPRGVVRRTQGSGDLGVRMVRQLRMATSGPVCLIGSDIPAVTRTHVFEGFRKLRGADAVLGPAGDGGYWLIGLQNGARLTRRALAGVRWSGPHAMADTIGTLAGLRVAFADTLDDVDTLADLRKAC